MSKGTRWIRAAIALADEHVKRQRESGDGPDKAAFFTLLAEFQNRPRYRKSEFSELDGALIQAYALAACAYLQPRHARNWRMVKGASGLECHEEWSRPWRPEEHGLWAGGNAFGSLMEA